MKLCAFTHSCTSILKRIVALHSFLHISRVKGESLRFISTPTQGLFSLILDCSQWLVEGLHSPPLNGSGLALSVHTYQVLWLP